MNQSINNLSKLVCAAAISASLSTRVLADVTSLVGDKDGFGIPGAPAVPANGTSWAALGGVYYTDYRSAADLANAPFTDIWGQTSIAPFILPVSYIHSYSLSGAPISATLSIQESGMADGRGPWDVVFNGTTIGQIGIFASTAGDQIQLLSWNVPVGLLTGNDTINLVYKTPITNDGFAINFSQLNIVTVPEPSTPAMAGLGGLASLVASRRRK